MASNVTFTAQEGGTNVTLYGTYEDAVANNRLQFLGLACGRESPWEKVKHPGRAGIRAKFMGARSPKYSIRGKIIASTESAMETARQLIINLNRTQEYYVLGWGGGNLNQGAGVIVETVEFEYHGDGKGFTWYFKIDCTDLGG